MADIRIPIQRNDLAVLSHGFDRRKQLLQMIIPSRILHKSRHRSLRFLRGLENSATPHPTPTMYKGKNEEDTRLGDPQAQSVRRNIVGAGK